MDARSVFLICAVAAVAYGAHAATERALHSASVVPNYYETYVGGVRVETRRVYVDPPEKPSEDFVVVWVEFKKAFYKEPFVMLDLEKYILGKDDKTCWEYELHDANEKGFYLYFKNPCPPYTFDTAALRYTAVGN